MNNKVRDVLRYILKNYPYPRDLSKTRVTKLVYLSDWFMAKENNEQITNITWYFDHYGPYVSDVLDEADEDKKISVNRTESAFGTTKYILEAKVDKNLLDYSSLSKIEKVIVDKVIEETKFLTWNDFISYVYDTYPVRSRQKYEMLNLIELAEEERTI